MSDTPTCATCIHWTGTPSSHSADCRLHVYTGLVPFSLTCAQHATSTPPPPVAPDMQSQVRGVPTIVQMWGPRP